MSILLPISLPSQAAPQSHFSPNAPRGVSLLYRQSNANWALTGAEGETFHLWDATGGSGAHGSRDIWWLPRAQGLWKKIQ